MKIMVVLSRVPYPLTKGDKLRAFNQIKYLSQNHEIYLFCVSHQKIQKQSLEILRKYCVEICVSRLSLLSSVFNTIKAYFKGNPLQIGYFYSRKAHKKYHDFEQKVNPDRIYCQFIRTTEYVIDSKVPKILDYQDALSKNVERRTTIAPFYLRPILRYESKHLRKYETKVFDFFDAKVIISDADKQCINHPQRNDIQIIPNGVDTEYFSPIPTAEKTFDVVFIGNMSYPPNIDAAHFLVKEIMPQVWRKIPQAKVLIAGVNPVISLKMLASERITVSGWVEDIRQSYAKARLFIAPMRIGTGLQNKLLEAMAMQIPCITSSLSNASLQAKNEEEILLAETSRQYANAIEQLLSDEILSKKISEAGYCYVHSNFSWEKFTNDLETIIIILMS